MPVDAPTPDRDAPRVTDPGADPITDHLDDRDAPSPTTGTYPEARGPHLPDTVTRLGAFVWVFLLLGVARLIWFVRESPPVAPYDLATVVTYGSAIVPSVAVVLLPAALLLRHGDALHRARTLLLGTILFTVVEALRVLNPALQPIFEQLTPGSEETPYLVPLALVYNAAIGLLGSYAIANIALGLARARRYEDPSGTRIVSAAMIVAVSLVAVGGVVAVSLLPLDEIPMTPTVILYLASTVVLSVVFAASWAYLAAVTIRGAGAGELPESGWSAVAIGSGLIIAAYVVRSVLVAVTPTPDTQPLFTTIGHMWSLMVALGYLGFLVGLFLGLPSLDDVDAEDVDDEGLDEASFGEASFDEETFDEETFDGATDGEARGGPRDPEAEPA
jgi:hypothetical protein